MLNTTRTAELSFHINSEIGQEGKNSQVFTATDLQLSFDIVVKKILKKSFSNVNEYFIESSLLQLSSHPNVVPIHYGCQDADHIFLAMPYFKNGSLKKRMQKGPISVRETVVWCTQVLSGLNNIHSKKLIHFDVKPDNILFSDRGEALLSDFGLAKQTSYGGTAGQDRIYSSMVPPEAFKTDVFNRQFDIYQFGLTLHRICVGDDVFYGEYATFKKGGILDTNAYRVAVVNGQFPKRDNYPEHIPQCMINVIKKCLEVDLKDRYVSAIDVVNDFAGIEGELLDWELSHDVNGRTWSKTTAEGVKIDLSVTTGGDATAWKKTMSGKPQRITAYCNVTMGRAAIKQFLRKH